MKGVRMNGLWVHRPLDKAVVTVVFYETTADYETIYRRYEVNYKSYYAVVGVLKEGEYRWVEGWPKGYL